MKNAAKLSLTNLETLVTGDGAGKPVPPKKRSLTEAQIQEIQAAAHAVGVIAGEEASLKKIEKQAADVLEQISAQYAELFNNVAQDIAQIREQSAELALFIANAMVPALIAQQPCAEIERLFQACIANLNAEPRIVIRVEEALLETLKEKIDQMARQAGYPGRVVMLGEPGALPAQCQIEWSDGGVTHRSPEQLRLIEQRIAEYVTGRSSGNSAPMESVLNQPMKTNDAIPDASFEGNSQ